MVDQSILSPDGDWLTLGVGRTNKSDIFIIRTDGTGLRQLTDDLHRDRSPDGPLTATRSPSIPTGVAAIEIWTINPDGSGLRKLTEPPAEHNELPAWSPNGLHMAVATSPQGSRLHLSPSSRGRSRPSRLHSLRGQVLFNSWSPDGEWLAWNTYRSGAPFRYSPSLRKIQKLPPGRWRGCMVER